MITIFQNAAVLAQVVNYFRGGSDQNVKQHESVDAKVEEATVLAEPHFHRKLPPVVPFNNGRAPPEPLDALAKTVTI